MSGSNRIFLIGIFLQLIITTLCMPLSSQTSKNNTGEKSGESVKNKLCVDNKGEFYDTNGKKIDIEKTIEIEEYTTLSAHDGCLESVSTGTTPQNTGSDKEIESFEKQADGSYIKKGGDETKADHSLEKVLAHMAQLSRDKEHESLIKLHTDKRDWIISLRS